MTNDELAKAIEVADTTVKGCGTCVPRYAPWLKHLEALLAEQRRRAVGEKPE